jgi:YhcH/YjgK/YiaL family protein
MKVVAFDETKDLLIYKGKSNGNLVMIPGEFVIFFPEDVHMPGLSINNISSKVIKIVFKIKI